MELIVARSRSFVEVKLHCVIVYQMYLCNKDSTEVRLRSNRHAKLYDTRMIPRQYSPPTFRCKSLARYQRRTFLIIDLIGARNINLNAQYSQCSFSVLAL
jgi:hypothetical protein